VSGYMKDSSIKCLYRWVRGWKIAGELKKYGLN
jgi:hypothetical protein